MERAELERLDRDTLIERAEEAGVTRARILTRPELIDELLLRSAAGDTDRVERARGFFGRARDLLARVVERGLHLPDAAEIIRATRAMVPPPSRIVTSALPTVTLAEIYATQGHKDRAIETLKRVLDREPEHAAARALVGQLEDADYVPPPPPLPPEEAMSEAPPPMTDADEDDDPRVPAAIISHRGKHAANEAASEPSGMLDDAPLPAKYDVDECVAIPVDPTTLFVYWEVRTDTMAYLKASRPGGVLSLRLAVILPTWDGPRTEIIDQDVTTELGDWFVRNLARGAVVRAAIGWRNGSVFMPLAHSPALETPVGAPDALAAGRLVRWTVDGAFPISPEDSDAEAIRRALGRARAKVGDHAGHPIGASERFAGSSAAATFG